MPKVTRTKKKTPEGWELIEPTLEELETKMREGELSFLQNLSSEFMYHKASNNHNFPIAAETEPHEGKRKVESLWPIFKIHHQKSKYIYDLFYRRKAISRGSYSINLLPDASQSK